MPDGTLMRVAYAGKTGHPYTPIGRLLVEMGELERENVTMAMIRAWLEANPARAHSLMMKNRSFIFFADTGEADPAIGPIGAASVPLTAGRSLALDHTLHTFGTPVWIATHTPLPWESKKFRRLMTHQDTGSAITGPARGDLFIGSGAEAGTVAGAIRHAADFYVLVPRNAS
jgi:membrane-bound lytic murein transglycosylase A